MIEVQREFFWICPICGNRLQDGRCLCGYNINNLYTIGLENPLKDPICPICFSNKIQITRSRCLCSNPDCSSYKIEFRRAIIEPVCELMLKERQQSIPYKAYCLTSSLFQNLIEIIYIYRLDYEKMSKIIYEYKSDFKDYPFISSLLTEIWKRKLGINLSD